MEGQSWSQLVAGLNIERLIIGAMFLGYAQRAFDDTLAYVKERKQFGKPVGSFQALSHRIADLATEIEATRLLVYNTAQRVAEDPSALFPREASMVKLKATELAKHASLEGMQMMGGYGVYPSRVTAMMPEVVVTTMIHVSSLVRRGGLACEGAKVQPVDARGIGDHVDRGDPAAGHHEGHYREGAVPHEDHRAGRSVDRGGADLPLRAAEQLGLFRNGSRTRYDPHRAGAEVAAQHHIRIKHGNQTVEIAGTSRGKERVDYLTLGCHVAVWLWAGPPDSPAGAAGELARRLR